MTLRYVFTYNCIWHYYLEKTVYCRYIRTEPFLGEFGNQITPADAKIVSDKNTVFTFNGKEKKMWELNSRANLAQFHPNWAGFWIVNLWLWVCELWLWICELWICDYELWICELWICELWIVNLWIVKLWNWSCDLVNWVNWCGGHWWVSTYMVVMLA